MVVELNDTSHVIHAINTINTITTINHDRFVQFFGYLRAESCFFHLFVTGAWYVSCFVCLFVSLLLQKTKKCDHLNIAEVILAI